MSNEFDLNAVLAAFAPEAEAFSDADGHVEVSTGTVLARRPRPRRRGLAAGLSIAASLAAAVVLLLQVLAAPTAPVLSGTDPAEGDPAATPTPVSVVAQAPAPSPIAPPAQYLPRTSPLAPLAPRPAPAVVSSPPRPSEEPGAELVFVESPPPTPVVGLLRPGLRVLPGGRAHLAGGTAVLERGELHFDRDDQSDPGVGAVVWDRHDLRATPVGTSFVAIASGDVLAVGVSHGVVAISGGIDDRLGQGEVLLAVASGGRLLRLDATGRSLEEVAREAEALGVAAEVARAVLERARWGALDVDLRRAVEEVR